MDRFFSCAQRAIEAHGGIVEKFIGDAVMAVFGIPQAHEDDALRAARAAVDIQKGVAALNEAATGGETIAVRVGINTGEVLAIQGGEGRTGVVGDPVNAAARLEKLAEPGGIVLGSTTHRLVRTMVTTEAMGPLALKGIPGAVDGYVLLAVDPPSASGRTFDAPLVGRTREMDALQQAYKRVAEDNVCVLFTLLGPAGIGKSRLVAELVATTVDEPRVLTGRCLPYGDGITFWPITEALYEAAHITDRDSQSDAMSKLRSLMPDDDDGDLIATLLGEVLGLSPASASQEEIFWAIRKTFESLAREGPLILVFDDIHWAEETFLDLIDNTVDAIGDVPILLLCIARPELLEIRPTWSGGKVNATTMLLEPLKERESMELFAGLLGDESAILPLLMRILDVSGGNPLFLEETVSMLVDEGVITKTDGRWETHTNVAQITIPPTINALLTARLDQLPNDERIAIDLAAVMGKVFAAQAVRELNDSDADISAALESLARKGLTRLAQEEFAGEEQYRFRHLLIRDAAYQGIPKERRAELHERYAVWLTDVLAERAAEYEEIIGYHLEQACGYMRELHADQGAIDSLGRRAGEALFEAGRRAANRDDSSAAINLFTRAIDVLPTDDPSSAYALLELAVTHMDHGDFGTCEEILERAIERAVALGERKVEARGRLRLVESHIHTMHTSAEEARAASEEAIKVFDELGDSVGLAEAWRLLSYAFDTIGRSSESQNAMTQAIAHAAATGDESRAHLYRRIQIRSLSWSPIPLSELAAETRKFIAEATAMNDRRGEALGFGILAEIEASEGRIDEAHVLLEKQEAIYDDLGLDLARAWGVFETAAVELLADDLEAAEVALRRACAILESKEEKAVLPTLLGMLADVRCSRGDLEDAEQLLAKATSIAVEDDLLTQIKCRTVTARVNARRGAEAEAFALAQEAIALAEATEYLDWRAGAWMDLAEIAETFGRRDDVKNALVNAIDLFERKEMTLPARKATERLAELGA